MACCCRYFLVFLGLLSSAGLLAAADAPTSADSRQVWQLLDYIAVDYRGAVSDGQVVSPAEYAEMQEFATSVQTHLAALPNTPGRDALLSGATVLKQEIESRSSPETVARLAHELADGVLASYPVPLAPRSIPDLSRGEALYISHCSACHGDTGAADAPVAKMLDPPPIAFTDVERARERSPFSYYQTITQGVAGTSMASFGSLAESDRWALAFYVATLPYSDAQRRTGERLWRERPQLHAAVPTLEALSRESEGQVAARLGHDASSVMAFLRGQPAAVSGDSTQGLSLVRARLADSVAAYQAGNVAQARQFALSAYLDGFEPLEPLLAATNAPLLAKIEAAMAAYRSDLGRHVAPAALNARIATIDSLLLAAEESLHDQNASPTTAFLGSFTILLREGVEALLIVIAIVAFLRKAERRDLMPYVHGGWIGALIAGVFTWAAATYVVTISGAQREVTEGFSSLLAAAVLLSVGLWMHNKSLAGRWQHYLREKLSHALSHRSAWFLAGLAFVAVYREVFETILFYAALWTQGGHRAIVAGLFAAAIALVLVAYGLLRATRRLPISQFFAVSSVLIGVLAVVLAGKGVAALQEAGLVELYPINGPRLAPLGIYPNLQSMLAQFAVVGLVIAGFAWNHIGVRRQRHLDAAG